MNFLNVVRAITTPQSVKDEAEAVKKAAEIEKNFQEQEDLQHYNVWSAMPQTKALLNELTNTYNEYVEKAKESARFSLADRENTNQLLVQATTIEKVIKYVRTRESIIPNSK